jgi:hypothetical protein
VAGGWILDSGFLDFSFFGGFLISDIWIFEGDISGF